MNKIRSHRSESLVSNDWPVKIHTNVLVSLEAFKVVRNGFRFSTWRNGLGEYEVGHEVSGRAQVRGWPRVQVPAELLACRDHVTSPAKLVKT